MEVEMPGATRRVGHRHSAGAGEGHGARAGEIDLSGVADTGEGDNAIVGQDGVGCEIGAGVVGNFEERACG